MTILCSLTTGLLLDSTQTSPHPLFLNSDESASWDTVETLHVLSTVQDWQVIGDKTDAVTLERLTRDYWVR
ncbi:MAG TPA: hypothetical protein VG125_06880 [Pirellulales bacterium]|jgi:hypothetical protein|nr:hypothetical protein [Pirellulales bacterium]